MEQLKRYEKQVPGHRVQVDKFLSFRNQDGREIKRYQYTAIDDATRARALRIYDKHHQSCAIDFVDYILAKFPFRIHTIPTDNGHEVQAKFHWHLRRSWDKTCLYKAWETKFKRQGRNVTLNGSTGILPAYLITPTTLISLKNLPNGKHFTIVIDQILP